jgi:arginase
VAPGGCAIRGLIVEHARQLAERIGALRRAGQVPLVLGGDCSLLVAAGLALRRAGRYGLAHLDGHTDFRHPGNSAACASLAGEDLAQGSSAEAHSCPPVWRSIAVEHGCRWLVAVLNTNGR